MGLVCAWPLGVDEEDGAMRHSYTMPRVCHSPPVQTLRPGSVTTTLPPLIPHAVPKRENVVFTDKLACSPHHCSWPPSNCPAEYRR